MSYLGIDARLSADERAEPSGPFRRPHSREPRQRCLSPFLKGLQPGPTSSNQFPTALGTLVSDRPLAFTDDFPDPASPRPTSTTAGSTLRCGCRPFSSDGGWSRSGSAATAAAGLASSFRQVAQRNVPNPLTRDGAKFLSQTAPAMRPSPTAAPSRYRVAVPASYLGAWRSRTRWPSRFARSPSLVSRGRPAGPGLLRPA